MYMSPPFPSVIQPSLHPFSVLSSTSCCSSIHCCPLMFPLVFCPCSLLPSSTPPSFVRLSLSFSLHLPSPLRNLSSLHRSLPTSFHSGTLLWCPTCLWGPGGHFLHNVQPLQDWEAARDGVRYHPVHARRGPRPVQGPQLPPRHRLWRDHESVLPEGLEFRILGFAKVGG